MKFLPGLITALSSREHFYWTNGLVCLEQCGWDVLVPYNPLASPVWTQLSRKQGEGGTAGGPGSRLCIEIHHGLSSSLIFAQHRP